MSQTTALLDEVFCRHYDSLIAWCRRRVLAGMEEPEDLVHKAYLRCNRRWSEQLKSQENEAAYLYRALRWVVLDALRARAREKNRIYELPRRNESVRWMSLHQLIAREAIGSLRGRQLQVCLAMMEGKSEEQIRGELRIKPGALAVYVCRARAKLCKFLEVSNRRRRSSKQSSPQAA